MDNNNNNNEKKNILEDVESPIDLTTLSDEQIMKLASDLMTVMSMATNFISNEDGLLTHEVISLSAGDLTLSSQPFRLGAPMQPILDAGLNDNMPESIH